MLKKEFLDEYGLSQNQLAKAIGISPNRIAGIGLKARHWLLTKFPLEAHEELRLILIRASLRARSM